MSIERTEPRTTTFDGVVQATQDAAYTWDAGTYPLVFADFEGRQTQYGDAVLFKLHEAGDPDHQISGMASQKTSLQSKFMQWVGVLTGRTNAQLMAESVNLRDHIGAQVLGVVQNKPGNDGGEVSFVADIMPLPKTTTSSNAPEPQPAVSNPQGDEDAAAAPY